MPKDNFLKVKEGMDKADVLDLLGNPYRVNQKQSTHIWTYRFYGEKESEYKEIHFLKSRVIYVGEQKHFERVVLPNKSAYTEETLNLFIEQEAKKEDLKKIDAVGMEEEMRQLEPEEPSDFEPIN